MVLENKLDNYSNIWAFIEKITDKEIRQEVEDAFTKKYTDSAIKCINNYKGIKHILDKALEVLELLAKDKKKSLLRIDDGYSPNQIQEIIWRINLLNHIMIKNKTTAINPIIFKYILLCGYETTDYSIALDECKFEYLEKNKEFYEILFKTERIKEFVSILCKVNNETLEKWVNNQSLISIFCIMATGKCKLSNLLEKSDMRCELYSLQERDLLFCCKETLSFIIQNWLRVKEKVISNDSDFIKKLQCDKDEQIETLIVEKCDKRNYIPVSLMTSGFMINGVLFNEKKIIKSSF